MADLFEKLDVETPEQIALEFPLAGLGSRSLAFMFDTLIQILVALVVVIVLAYYGDSLELHMHWFAKWMTAIMIFVGFCLYWGYFAAFEILWNGQTPGKRYAKVRVISVSGRPITAFEGVARNFMRAIDAQFLYLVGIVAMSLDRQNRRLGDMVAGTVVVHESAEVSDTMWYSDSTRPVANVGDVARALTDTEFQVIETFLSRRLDLTPEARVNSATTIAERIGAKLQIEKANRPSDEDFLEDVARRFRDEARFR